MIGVFNLRRCFLRLIVVCAKNPEFIGSDAMQQSILVHASTKEILVCTPTSLPRRNSNWKETRSLALLHRLQLLLATLVGNANVADLRQRNSEVNGHDAPMFDSFR